MSHRIISKTTLTEHEYVNDHVQQLSDEWPQGIDLSHRTTLTSFSVYPFLLVSLFPGINTNKVRQLNLASRLMSSAIFIQDKLIDVGADSLIEKSAQLPTDLIRSNALQFEAYTCLHQLFPAQSAFWQHFRRYYQNYCAAAITQIRYSSETASINECSEKLALETICQKNGMAKAVIAGLCEIASDYTNLELLESAFDCLYIGVQLLDDLQDWKEDLRLKIPTLLLARVLSGRSKDLSQDQIARIIYYEGHAQYTLKLAIDKIREAEKITAHLPELQWHAQTSEINLKCQTLLQDIEKIVFRNLERVRLKQRIDYCLPKNDHRNC